jgi:hypothetical protein
MKIPYPALSATFLLGSLTCAFYLGQTDYPFDLVGVRFCPETANKGSLYRNITEDSQKALDLRFCRHEVRLLKQVWEKKQFEGLLPGNIQVRDIKRDSSFNPKVFIAAPLLMAMSYYLWLAHCDNAERKYYEELENFKTAIRTKGVDAKQERELKEIITERKYDRIKLDNNLMSRDAIQDRANKQTELMDLQHDVAVTEYQKMIAEIKKKWAEADRDTAKARKEMKKYSDTTDPATDATQEASDKELINQLIEALKNHEDGWLWTVINAVKPLWIIGEQGTGKTNTAVAIALIRKHCLNVPIYRIADRHMNGANSKAWKLLDAQVKADNDFLIIEALQDTYDRRLERIAQDLSDDQSEQFVLDEFTHLKDIDEETVKRFIKSTFSDTRKAKERFIGVTHLGTNEAFGDGTAAMRKAGSILIEKFTVNGERPLPRVVVRHGLVDSLGNKLEDVEKSLPSWFEANKIYNHFNGKPIDFEV